VRELKVDQSGETDPDPAQQSGHRDQQPQQQTQGSRRKVDQVGFMVTFVRIYKRSSF